MTTERCYKYAIVENEFFALESLMQVVRSLRPDYQLVFTSESIEDTVRLLGENPDLDFMFMDIELTDGNCFEIFSQVDVKLPVIFTTAYDEYAIKAFRVNSIDYLMKPISEDSVRTALEKLETLIRPAQSTPSTGINYEALLRAVRQNAEPRNRILVCVGDEYLHININDVAYFRRDGKYVNAVLFNGKERITDFSNLNEVSAIVDPSSFYRISRNIITNIRAIKHVHKWFGGRLKVDIASETEAETIVVTALHKKEFLVWMGGTAR